MQPSKPRLQYAAWRTAQKPTIFALIDRYIRDMNGTATMAGIKPLGESHHFTLRRLQRAPIAQIVGAELKKGNVIDFARWRRATVQPCTVNQDVTYLAGVLRYAGSAWDDCDDVSAAAIDVARPLLVQHGLVGPGKPRNVRVTEDQLERIKAWFDEAAKHPKMKLKRMADLVEFAIRSSRRRGELCRITHGDVDYEQQVYWVRNVKHPTRRLGNHKMFFLFPELAEIIRRQPRLDPNDPNERIWPYNPASVTQAYIRAKKALGLHGLIRLHDNRGEAITRRKLSGMSIDDICTMVSGQDSIQTAERHYDRSDALSVARAKYPHLMQKPAAQMQVAA